MNKRFKRYKKLLAISLAAFGPFLATSSGKALRKRESCCEYVKNTIKNALWYMSGLWNNRTNARKNALQEERNEINARRDALQKERDEIFRSKPDGLNEAEKLYTTLLVDYARDIGKNELVDLWYEKLKDPVKNGELKYIQGLSHLMKICYGTNQKPDQIPKTSIENLANTAFVINLNGETITKVVYKWIDEMSPKNKENLLNNLIENTEGKQKDDLKMAKDDLKILKDDFLLRGKMLSYCSTGCVTLPILNETIRSTFQEIIKLNDPVKATETLAQNVISTLEEYIY